MLEVSHEIGFESIALSGENGYVMLTDCGGARYLPTADTLFTSYKYISNPDNPKCLLSAGNQRDIQLGGQANLTDLALFDEAHPLSAVIAFGEGEPRKPVLLPMQKTSMPTIAGDVYTLTSGCLRMGIRKRNNGVSMLGISMRDMQCVDSYAHLPLAQIVIKNLKTGIVSAYNTERGWDTVKVHADAKRVNLYFDRIQGIDIALSVEGCAVEGNAIQWRTKVLNKTSDYTVLSATYPGINLVGGENVRLFIPSASGRVLKDAYRQESRFHGYYPSGFEGVCPVLGLYQSNVSEHNGLYVAVHDASAARKEVACALFRNETGYFYFDYPAENLGRAYNSFELGGYMLVKVFSGDWYDMAKIYKEFVDASAPWVRPMGREDSPAWMKDVPMYIMDWMPNDNPDADPVPVSIRPPVEPPRDNWYQKPIALAKRLGLPIGYHLYNWHWIPFNNDYPFYFPVKEGLEEGVLEMHKYGIYVMPYVNGRIVDTRDTRGENIRFDAFLRAGATKNMDGSLNIETYASHEPDGSLCRLAAMCPTSPVWREMLADIMRRLFTEYHMDAVYIDQVAAAKTNLCCDPTHNHTPGNGDWWVKGYRILMERLRQECPEGCGFTTESNAETYADQFDGFLTWAWVYYDMVPFFPKIYAGRIAMLGRNTNGYKKTDAQFFRFHVGEAVMFGQQIGWINADVVDNMEKIDYLERMCHMRWDYKDFFSKGEMLRPPMVTEGQSTYLSDISMGKHEMNHANIILCCAWKQDGKYMLAVTNTGNDAATVRVVQDGTEYTIPKDAQKKSYGECEWIGHDAQTVSANLGGRSCLVLTWIL
uniref:DUF6259 domain-containing protein n=1 Tax=uncultured bacterium fosmid pJB148G3 TaxID=1478052 RepID=A0A0H3UAA5_9BACT|nr:hypothetical protein [uncultured bacterium fosmid pJB148G3]